MVNEAAELFEPEEMKAYSKDDPANQRKKNFIREEKGLVALPPKSRLLERATLSEEESKRFRSTLAEKGLAHFLEGYNLHRTEEKLYKGLTKGVLRTLSEYFEKPSKELLISDIYQFYRSISSVLPDGNPNKDIIRAFRGVNNLTRFGSCQYRLIRKYSESLDERL